MWGGGASDASPIPTPAPKIGLNDLKIKTLHNWKTTRFKSMKGDRFEKWALIGQLTDWPID